MNIAEEKINIIRQISSLEDENLLAEIKNLLNNETIKISSNQHDFWNDLTENQQKRIYESIQSIDKNGSRTTHEEVIDIFRNKLK